MFTILKHRRKSFRVVAVVGTDYRSTILADSPVAYYRLGESSGTTASDETGSYDATYTNSPTLGEDGVISGDASTSVSLASASNQYAEIDSNLSITAYPFTIEAWVKTTATADSTVGSFVVNTTNNQMFALRVDASGYAYTYARNTSGVLAESTTAVNDGDWHHIVAVFAASNDRTIYVDGYAEDTHTAAVTLPAINRFSIGRMGDTSPGSYFNGTVDEVAVYDTALSASTIASHYSSGRITLEESFADDSANEYEWSKAASSTYVGTLVAPSSSYTATRLEFYLKKTGTGGGTITAEIWSATGSSGSETPDALLATSTTTVAASGVSATKGFVAFDFAGQAIASYNKYFFVMKTPTTGDNSNYYDLTLGSSYNTTNFETVRGDATPTWAVGNGGRGGYCRAYSDGASYGLDSDVLLYVPFTDANASTGADGYVLSSGAHTLTTDVFARAGNAVINTDQTKMNGSATGAYNPAGANSDGWVLDSTTSTGLEVGAASPLSIQFWFYCSNDASNSYGRLLSWGGYHDSGSGFEIETYNFDYDNFIFYEFTGSADNRRSLGTFQLNANAWNHIYWAFQPSGSSYVGINGTVTEISNSYISNFAPTVDLNLLKTAGNSDDAVKGYVQEFIVKNTVPYTANFTPSTTPLINDFPTTNLVAFYKLNESSGDALDISGNGRTFTDNGTVASTTGSIGGATVNVRTLDRPAGKYFSRADDDNLDVGDGESFTISFWAKVSSSMGNWNSGGIFSKRNAAGASDAGYSIDLRRGDSDVYIRYNAVSDGSTTVGDTNTDTGIATDAWAHYMMVFTADATVITYVNNAQYNSDDASSVTGSLANAIPSYIGQRMYNSQGDIIADVSHIGFWKKALTSTERAAVYNSGKVFSPDGWRADLGDALILNGISKDNTGGVESAISADGDSTVYGGYVTSTMNFYDGTKDGSWTDDGHGLIWNHSTSATDWVSLIGTTSGTFYVYEEGTSKLIYSLAWSGTGTWSGDMDKYGTTSVDYTGTVPSHNTRVDVYHIKG